MKKDYEIKNKFNKGYINRLCYNNNNNNNNIKNNNNSSSNNNNNNNNSNCEHQQRQNTHVNNKKIIPLLNFEGVALLRFPLLSVPEEYNYAPFRTTSSARVTKLYFTFALMCGGGGFLSP